MQCAIIYTGKDSGTLYIPMFPVVYTMKHIPNILTSFRIAMIPFFIWQIRIGNFLAAGIILIVSSITDFLDGLLARKFNWITKLGKLLDPIADKFTQVTVAVILISIYKEYWYFFLFIIFKDFVILLLGLVLVGQGMNYSGSKLIGKISTFYFYTATIVLVLFREIPGAIEYVILAIAAILALISGLSYIPEYKRYKSEITGESIGK